MTTRDRYLGCLLGLAIGDALGNTTESILPGPRRQRYGEIRSYLPNLHAGGPAGWLGRGVNPLDIAGLRYLS